MTGASPWLSACREGWGGCWGPHYRSCRAPALLGPEPAGLPLIRYSSWLRPCLLSTSLAQASTAKASTADGIKIQGVAVLSAETPSHDARRICLCVWRPAALIGRRRQHSLHRLILCLAGEIAQQRFMDRKPQRAACIAASVPEPWKPFPRPAPSVCELALRDLAPLLIRCLPAFSMLVQQCMMAVCCLPAWHGWRPHVHRFPFDLLVAPPPHPEASKHQSSITHAWETPACMPASLHLCRPSSATASSA